MVRSFGPNLDDRSLPTQRLFSIVTQPVFSISSSSRVAYPTGIDLEGVERHPSGASAADGPNGVGAAGRLSKPALAGLESVMFGIGTTELLILFGIVIVIFGARRLPELGSGLGKAIKNFKAGLSGKDEIDVTPTQEEVTDGDRDS
jgi:sec-independent protein translocase protein TatA